MDAIVRLWTTVRRRRGVGHFLFPSVNKTIYHYISIGCREGGGNAVLDRLARLENIPARSQMPADLTTKQTGKGGPLGL